MQRARLLTTLLLTVSCGSALAATPVFQLNAPQSDRALVQAIDTYPSGRTGTIETMPADSSSAPVKQISAASIVFSDIAASSDAWLSGMAVPVVYYPGADSLRWPGKVTSRLNISDDSLFYFLRDFKARPLQKPARWSILLIGLCFLLYQVRRRPTRTSVGFPSATKQASPSAA